MDIEKLLKDKLEDIDLSEVLKEVAENFVSGRLDGYVSKMLEKIVDNKVNKIIGESLDSILTGGEIEVYIDFEKKKYKSLEEYLIVAVKNKMEHNWDISEEIDQYISKKINKIIDENREDVIKEITDGLIPKIKIEL